MFSIVIVHWNTPELLRACLDAVVGEAANSGSVAEIIVVDSASPGEGFRTAIPRHPAIRLIEMPENRGYAAGCNAGAAEASREHLLFMNADVELQPGSVEVLCAILNLSPHIGLVAPLLQNPDGTLQSAGYSYPGIANVVSDLFPVGATFYNSRLNGRFTPGDGVLPYKVDYPLGAVLAVKRAALDEVGGWDESYGMYCEELELCRRLDKGDWTRVIAPRARAIHHSGRSTSQRPAEMREALWRSRGRYHRRWESRVKFQAIRALLAAGTHYRSLNAPDEIRDGNRSFRRAFDEGARS